MIEDGYFRWLWLAKAWISWCCARVINNPIFEVVCITVILLNSVILAIDTPGVEKHTESEKTWDNFFLYFYIVECLLKILAKGYFFQN
jgi:hypothetical protein